MECADEVCGNPDINKDLRKRKAKMFYGVVHEIKIVWFFWNEHDHWRYPKNWHFPIVQRKSKSWPQRHLGGI